MQRIKRLTALLFAALFVLSGCTLEGDLLLIRTADPHVNIGVRLLPAPVLPTVTPTPAPECLVKGNISASGVKIAHSPGQANYNNVVISPEKGEKMFCSLAEAEAEGWRAAQN